MVWAIVYTLFLSFGLSIGSQVWDAFGPEQPGPDGAGSDSSTEVSVSGTFFGNNTVWNSAMSNGTSNIQTVCHGHERLIPKVLSHSPTVALLRQ